MSMKKRVLPLIAVICLAFSTSGYADEQVGKVQSAGIPVAYATVTLYSAGSPDATTPAAALATATSDEKGNFKLSYTPPKDTNSVLYLIADGVSSVRGVRTPLRLSTVLGVASVPAGVVVNERTTVATAYAMAQFISGANIAGTAPGLQNAAAVVKNLVDISTGQVSTVLSSWPNGTNTSTMSGFNSLSNMLCGCVMSPITCQILFALATPPNGSIPHDTLQAAVNIARNPWNNVQSLYELSQLYSTQPYGPVLTAAPAAWTLAIKYIGNGHEFDGPGNMAIDKDGNIWITNNYEYGADPAKPVCAGSQLLKLTPAGADAAGAPFSGGGISGAGFGITIDTKGDIWVGNFGFQGQGCTVPPPSNSVSKFSSTGAALSPSTGFTSGGISSPQGTVSDQMGNIWVANYGNNTVTRFPGGNTGTPQIFGNVGLDQPFHIAIDSKANAWISSSGNDSVVALNQTGSPLSGSPFTGGGLKTPLGVAVDSFDNVWIADSGGGSVTLIKASDKTPRQITGGGLTTPWGIAVDGNDNVWVANFEGQRLTEFCGARTSKCPAGYSTGSPISPSMGYVSDALLRNTGVAIDPSGNVWLANNWKTEPVQTNPGGDAMVMFVGLAAPVKSPLNGPPQPPYDQHYDEAQSAINNIYNQYGNFFGTMSGYLHKGSTETGSFYVQWFTNGTAIKAASDGYLYFYYNNAWYAFGIPWSKNLVTAAAWIDYMYVQYKELFGTKSGTVQRGTTDDGTYYVQWFTNGTAIMAWTDGGLYYYYGGTWHPFGIAW